MPSANTLLVLLFLEEEELIRTHRISLYHELGIKELKLLRYTVAEIANAQDRAIHKFFTDVQQQYDYMLGFEAKIQNLKSQIQIIEEMELRLATFTIILNSIILMQFDQIQGVTNVDVGSSNTFDVSQSYASIQLE